MPRFYTNSCNPVYDRWNFTSENIFDYSNERTDSSIFHMMVAGLNWTRKNRRIKS